MNFFNSRQFWVPAIVLVALIALVVILAKFVVPSQDNSQPIACKEGDLFNYTTGEACPGTPVREACQEGDSFDYTTGKPCAGVPISQTSCKPGDLFDFTTGERCQ